MAEEKKVSKHYPKSLYQGGDRSAEHRIVNSAEEELAARDEGFKMIDKDNDAKSVAAISPAPAPVAEKVEKAPAAKAKPAAKAPAKKKK